jgi:hypothetical protein
MPDPIQHTGLYDQATFEEQLSKRFPAVSQKITDDVRGLLHLEMAEFARATCQAIEQDVPSQVRTHFECINELFSNAEPDLENAIYVSYLENVFLGRTCDSYLSARDRPSPKLQQALIELEAHWEEIEKYCRERDLPKAP